MHTHIQNTNDQNHTDGETSNLVLNITIENILRYIESFNLNLIQSPDGESINPESTAINLSYQFDFNSEVLRYYGFFPLPVNHLRENDRNTQAELDTMREDESVSKRADGEAVSP